MTKTYTITNTTSGHVLGDYSGATPLDAYRASMADAGYPTRERAESAGYPWDEVWEDLSVEEVEADDAGAR